MPGMLKNRVAIITGASRGIGLEIACRFASEGCRLSLVARSGSELKKVEALLGKKYQTEVATFVCDVSDEATVQRVVQNTEEKFGQIDILINNAGVLGPVGPLMDICAKDWSQTINVNLTGTFLCIKAVLPVMQRQKFGRVINFSGGGALLPSPYFDAYSVTKAGVVRLTENLALELKGTGITVIAIAPGGVNTQMFDDMMAAGKEKVGEAVWNAFVARKEKGGDPIEQPVELALFLATGPTDMLNGRVISAKWDPWKNLEQHIKELTESDVYMMRRIMPKDRGFNWQ